MYFSYVVLDAEGKALGLLRESVSRLGVPSKPEKSSFCIQKYVEKVPLGFLSRYQKKKL